MNPLEDFLAECSHVSTEGASVADSKLDEAPLTCGDLLISGCVDWGK